MRRIVAEVRVSGDQGNVMVYAALRDKSIAKAGLPQ